MRHLRRNAILITCLGCATISAGTILISLGHERVLWGKPRAAKASSPGEAGLRGTPSTNQSWLSLTNGWLCYHRTIGPQKEIVLPAHFNGVIVRRDREITKLPQAGQGTGQGNVPSTMVSESINVAIWPLGLIFMLYPAVVLGISARRLVSGVGRNKSTLPATMTTLAPMGIPPSQKGALNRKNDTNRGRRRGPPVYIRGAMCSSCSAIFTAPFGFHGQTQCPSCGQLVEV